MHYLITGGAGFVGSNIALALRAAHPDARLTVFDSLHRRGSEKSLDRLKAARIDFVHGDVRIPGDLTAVGAIDALIECSAEPSVQSQGDAQRDFLLQTNLAGARKDAAEALRLHALVTDNRAKLSADLYEEAQRLAGQPSSSVLP